LVRDLDKFEMMQQAYEYEQKYKVDLSEFFNSFTMLKTELVKGWASELIDKRNREQKK
jgi:putative hydrolase of HD superfamily